MMIVATLHCNDMHDSGSGSSSTVSVFGSGLVETFVYINCILTK